MRNIYTAEDIAHAIRLYRRNRPWEEIASFLGKDKITTQVNLTNWRKKLGIPARENLRLIDWDKVKNILKEDE